MQIAPASCMSSRRWGYGAGCIQITKDNLPDIRAIESILSRFPHNILSTIYLPAEQEEKRGENMGTLFLYSPYASPKRIANSGSSITNTDF
jgi:hypothetical protein